MTTARERFGTDPRLTIYYAWRKDVERLGSIDWSSVAIPGYESYTSYEARHRDDDHVAVMELPTTGGIDAMGYTDACSQANFDYLTDFVGSQEANGETPALVVMHYSNQDHWGLLADVELDEFTEYEVDRLLDYPCLDEERMAEIESQAEQEFWERDGCWDVACEIENADADDVRGVVFDILREVSAWPEFEPGPTPVYGRDDWQAIVNGVREALKARRGAA